MLAYFSNLQAVYFKQKKSCLIKRQDFFDFKSKNSSEEVRHRKTELPAFILPEGDFII